MLRCVRKEGLTQEEIGHLFHSIVISYSKWVKLQPLGSPMTQVLSDAIRLVRDSRWG